MRARWLRVLAIGAAVAWFGAVPAEAHSGLQDTEPVASSVLDVPPSTVRLTFGHPVESRLASVELFDQHASKVSVGEPVHPGGDRQVLEVAVPPIGNGTWVVVWRVVSGDGNPTEGAFTFQVGTSSGDPVDVNDLLARVLAGRHADPAVGWLLGLSRWVGRLGAMVLVGGGALLLVAGRRPDQRESARRLLWAAWSWVLVGSIGVLVLSGPHITRRALGAALDVGLWRDVLGTQVGRALEIRWILLLAAGALILTWSASRSPWWRAGALTVGAGLVVTFPLAGHAAAAASGWGDLGALAVMVVHLSATSLWLGGLALVSLDRDEVLVRRWSRLATVAVPVAVVSGVVAVEGLVEDLGRLAETAWGRLLIVKVVLVAVVVVVGAVARWLLLRDGAASVRRVIAVELVLGLAVLSLATGLLAVPPEGERAPRPVDATVVQDSVVLQLMVTPARVGANEVHLVFAPPGGSLQPVSDVVAALELPGRPEARVTIELAFAGPNHWSGLVRVPYVGEWQLMVEATGSAGRRLVFSAPVTVSA